MIALDWAKTGFVIRGTSRHAIAPLKGEVADPTGRPTCGSAVVPHSLTAASALQLPVEDDIDLSDVELDDLERDEL